MENLPEMKIMMYETLDGWRIGLFRGKDVVAGMTSEEALNVAAALADAAAQIAVYNDNQPLVVQTARVIN